MNSKINILLIEDDKNTCSFIITLLTRNGYHVICACSGREGLSLAAANCPDVILLDLCLPDMDGCEVITSLRRWSGSPVIVLSARETEQDKVQALDLGADDYITKPFGTEELMARIRACLRHRYTGSSGRIYRALGLKIDLETGTVSLDGETIHLTHVEYRLLALLAEHSGRVLSYREIMNAIWGPYADGSNQILRVNMANIRHKIEKNPARPQYVFTEVGVGYRMRENECT
ncbi:MAG: response regulator transcription factor [Butyrivibrio sp.]|nr:response regulator transcription factor [Acetatifactor muris]MCM1558622.1 response regulator transcription factor [Butyrivibrio sp.]